MSNTNKPFGFRPVRNKDGGAWTGAVVRRPIAYNYGTALYIGDAIKLASGKVNIAAVTDAIDGIIVGFEIPTAANSLTPPSYWPAGGFATAGNSDVNALIVEDPGVLFEAQFGAATTVPTIADVGKYCKASTGTAGSTATGISGQCIDVSTLNANVSGLVWKFVDFVKRPTNDTASAYPRGLFFAVSHLQATRVAAA
jgi:hypothetical protein